MTNNYLPASDMTARDVIAKDLLAAVISNTHNYTRAINRDGMDKWLKDRCAECYAAADTLLLARLIKHNPPTQATRNEKV